MVSVVPVALSSITVEAVSRPKVCVLTQANRLNGVGSFRHG
jgi:hypothetical protein